MKRNKNNCDLKSCSLCTGCLKEWLPAIDANRKTSDFKKGESLFKEGDVVSGIYFLVSGKVKIHKKWGADKELIVRIAGAGDIVGHRGLGKEAAYPISATPLEPVTACFIDLNFFISSLKVNHEFAFKLLLFYAEELQESEKNMRNLAHIQAKGRMAYALLKLQERFGINEAGTLNIHISRQDIASFAGTTYETAFRILNELAQENILELSGKDIIIRDREALSNCV
jgi:CRP/FNR family transcriptional regulator